MVWVGMDIIYHLVPISLPGGNTFHGTRLLKAPSVGGSYGIDRREHKKCETITK